MCGCWRCGEPTYGLIKHSEENCINALKGALRSAREGREMVRATGETYRALLVEFESHRIDSSLDWMNDWTRRVEKALHA